MRLQDIKEHSGWADVRAELEKLRAELAALAPTRKQRPTMERLKTKLAALESAIEPTAMEAR